MTVIDSHTTPAPVTSATDATASDAPAPGDRLHVVGWQDPVVDRVGHDPRSWYVEHFWLPVLGPTSIWFLRRVAFELDLVEDGFTVEREEMARALGLGNRQGRHAPFTRALGRCVTFEVARWRGRDELAVRRTLAPLPRRHLLRLPSQLQRLHEAWTEVSARVPTFDEHRRCARRLAVGLLQVDDHIDTMEAQLLRWGVHPALAHDAVTWARALPTPA